MKYTTLTTLLTLAATLSLSAQNLIRSSGFEEGAVGWKEPYIPSDSTEKGCSFTISEESPYAGKYCGLLESTNYGRIAISPKEMPMAVEPGQKYKISAWVKVNKGFIAEQRQPGIIIRADLLNGNELEGVFTANWKGLSAILMPADALAMFVTPNFPTDWTQVEVELTIPQDVTRVRASIFLWRAIGQLYVDDFEVERIQ